MTTLQYYDGQILEREDYERKTYYEFEREDDGITQVPKDDVEFRFQCDVCEEVKEYSEVTRVGVQTHVCDGHVSDEVLEAIEDEEDDNE